MACLRLAAAPPPHLGTGLHRHAIGHAMQPAAQRVAGADRGGLPRQHQEGGLERVLDVVLVLQRPHGKWPGPSGRAARPAPRRPDSSQSAANRARSWPSPRPTAVPSRYRSRRCRKVPPSVPLAMNGSPPRARSSRQSDGGRATLSGCIPYRIREGGRCEAPDFLDKAGSDRKWVRLYSLTRIRSGRTGQRRRQDGKPDSLRSGGPGSRSGCPA